MNIHSTNESTKMTPEEYNKGKAPLYNAWQNAKLKKLNANIKLLQNEIYLVQIETKVINCRDKDKLQAFNKMEEICKEVVKTEKAKYHIAKLAELETRKIYKDFVSAYTTLNIPNVKKEKIKKD